MPGLFSRTKRKRKKEEQRIKSHIGAALLPSVALTAVPTTPPKGVLSLLRDRSSSAPPDVSTIGTQSDFPPLDASTGSDLPSVTSGLSDHSSDEEVFLQNSPVGNCEQLSPSTRPPHNRDHLDMSGGHGDMADEELSEVSNIGTDNQPKVSFSGSGRGSAKQQQGGREYWHSLKDHPVTPHVTKSKRRSIPSSGARAVTVSPLETVPSGNVILLKETNPDGSISYYAASPVRHSGGVASPLPPSATPPPTTPLSASWGPPGYMGMSPSYAAMLGPPPAPLGVHPHYTSTPMPGVMHSMVDNTHHSAVAHSPSPQNRENATTQTDSKLELSDVRVELGEESTSTEPLQKAPQVSVGTVPGSCVRPHSDKHPRVGSATSHTSSDSLSAGATYTKSNGKSHSQELVNGIHDTYKKIIEKMEARTAEAEESLRVLSAKNCELEAENVSMSTHHHRLQQLQQELERATKEKATLQRSLKEQEHKSSAFREKCEALEAEVMHLKMQNTDSVKEMEVVRKKSQAAQESLQKKVDKLRDGLHHERLEKEAMEESCQQLKKTTTRLQEKVDRLTLDQSQSMSVEDHRAALNEMQHMVESFKADAESNSEELAKEVRSLKRDKKALMSKLAGAKVTISQLEQKCSVLEDSHRRMQSQVGELEGELEASRDREALVNTQLSKAVAQAERMAGERDSLAQILKSHKELAASKQMKADAKIHKLERSLQTHKDRSVQYIQEASDVLDHQSEEHHSLRRTYQKEIRQLKESLREKQDELDVLKKERRKLQEHLSRTQLQAARF